MNLEKCLWHPWAADEQGFCWKCEEEKIQTNYISMLEKPKDGITWAVMQDLTARSARGVEKYNTTLEENNHDSMLQHAYEEALDLAQYLKKEITTKQVIQELVKETPNDQELGEKTRRLFSGRK